MTKTSIYAVLDQTYEAPRDHAEYCSEVEKRSVNISQMLGFLGTGLVVVGYVPQIHHLIREHCSAGISIKAFVLWGSASLLFLIHAIMIMDVVFTCVQLVNLVAGGVIVSLSRRYQGESCPTHRVMSRSRASMNSRNLVAALRSLGSPMRSGRSVAGSLAGNGARTG